MNLNRIARWIIIPAILLAVFPGVAGWQQSGKAQAAARESSRLNETRLGIAQDLVPQPPLEVSASDWPQVQMNPQRTGYSPETLGTNFRVGWTHPFQPEKVYPQVQAIVYAGKVFVGTEMGNLYALNAQTGAQVWVSHIGAPILNSVAAGNNKVFFGAMDGAVYGLSADTGNQVWKASLSRRLGFSTAPVFADGKVMLGGRNGVFYALNPETGVEIWERNISSPILQTAAWNNGKVYFGAMNMRVYALNSANGDLAWQSDRLPGMAFKDYWPVVYGGMVYVRPLGKGGLGVDEPAQAANAAAQQAILQDYNAHPGNYMLNLLRLNESNGSLAAPVIHYDFQTMNGATSPPCIDRNGYLIIPAPFPGGYPTGWGRLNPNTRIVDQILSDGTNAGSGSRDENMNVTCSANLVFAMHTEEMNANYSGAFNLDTRKWTHIDAGQKSQQMSTNTQGGGGNPVSISNGWIYHISFYELVARQAQP